MLAHLQSTTGRLLAATTACILACFTSVTALAQGAIEPLAEGAHKGGEANLILPDLHSQQFLGMPGDTLLTYGVGVCVLGLLFALVSYRGLKALPVHQSMADVAHLIYETCKTYLASQLKFLSLLWLFIAAIVVYYFGVLRDMSATKVIVIVVMSLLGMAGSAAVAWFGIRVNTFANARTAFASLRGKGFPVYAIPLRAGMSIGMLLISVELLLMLGILLVVPKDYAGPCFIGFAIGESLGAAALRIAGGIFTKIADIGSDLMKIVFKIKEDDARNPGVIADCVGDNAGDSVGPTADGFETYGVTGVALITFTLLAVEKEATQVQILVWIFAMRVMMIIASGLSYALNEAVMKAKFGDKDRFNFETPLTSLVWVTSAISVVLTFVVSYLLIPTLGLHQDPTLWWKLSIIISCGTLAGALIPELVKVFTSTESAHVDEVVQASKEGGASLNVLAGLTAGNFGAYWLGLAMTALMAIAYIVSETIVTGLAIDPLMIAPSVFAFGLVAFGFLGMGPVTIAVDSYGPVTDNAQSVYELSLIEQVPNVEAEVERSFGFRPNFETAKALLEENDGAGNTFKATAKPVLIGTAVVGATTMMFSIVVVLTEGLKSNLDKLSVLHPPFLLGLILGGGAIFWFTGASTQAVSTGAYRAVEFIKRNIKLEGVEKASITDSKRVVAICTSYAQKGMFNIFMTVFFSTLAFACLDPYLFIGYLISLALFGLFQALYLANAGGAWDNAKKVVETTLREKGTPLHDACVVGDTVGDPFKDTSSVAMNPVIKFTTLFGLLAVEVALELDPRMNLMLAAVFFAIAVTFVWRSFYRMRISSHGATSGESAAAS